MKVSNSEQSRVIRRLSMTLRTSIDWFGDGVALEEWSLEVFLDQGGRSRVFLYRSNWGRRFERKEPVSKPLWGPL